VGFEIKITSSSNDEVYYDELNKRIEDTVREFFSRNPKNGAFVRSIRDAFEVTDDEDDENPDPFTHIYKTRRDAEMIIHGLSGQIANYGYATVTDLKTLLSLPSEFQDMKHGWTDLQGWAVTHHLHDGGFRITFPRMLNIDN
jgi:hypothetical protein